MSLDDPFLQVQRWIDRAIRRLRLGAPPRAGRRRLLIVQLDGLSRAVLEKALARGDMPVLARLLGRPDGRARRRGLARLRGRGGHRLHPMTTGLPTSTPAFQMAAMCGVQPTSPGCTATTRWRTDIHFPHPGHAALVEASQAARGPGILRGGDRPLRRRGRDWHIARTPVLVSKRAARASWRARKADQMTRTLLGVTLAIGLVASLPGPTHAGGALIETTAPLADRSEESVKAAVVAAIDRAVRGAAAMGFAWFQLRDAQVSEGEVAIQILATDEESGPVEELQPGPAPDASPDDDTLSGERTPPPAIPDGPRLHI